MTITEQETQTYVDALSLPQYAGYSPGERYAELFAAITDPFGATVLDAGCGTGKGMLALRALGYTVSGCDLVDMRVDEAKGFPMRAGVSLWRPLVEAEADRYIYVYCTDVLEHIPPQFTMLVVANLLHAACDGVFLSISLIPDNLGVWVGKPLHQSVRSYNDWLADFLELADVTDARDLGTDAIYFLRPRR